MIAVIDYDAGNLRSVEKAFLSLGEQVSLTRDKEQILLADKVVLPGVGAFGDAMAKLDQYGLRGDLSGCRPGDPVFGDLSGITADV